VVSLVRTVDRAWSSHPSNGVDPDFEPGTGEPVAHASRLSVAVAVREGRYLVELTGELDVSTSDVLANEISRIRGPVWVDCRQLSFMDSKGFAKLIDLHKQSGSTVLFRVRPELREALRVLNLYGGLSIVDDC
jgi:anti-anti-sigma factor